MKLQQLRFFNAICQHGLNVTAAATALYTSQPGVSRQMRLFEEELGLSLFVRAGKTLISLTPAGEEILVRCQKVLKEINNIKSISQDLTKVTQGVLNISTTHTQAKYVLPPIIKSFHSRFPDVKVNLHQSTSLKNIKSTMAGEFDFTIASGDDENYKGLVKLDCFKWQRLIVVPKSHPLANENNITIKKLTQYPLVVYVYDDQESSSLVQTFKSAGVDFKIVFTARDSDIIKTYVRSEMGVGIIASMAYDQEVDSDLMAIETQNILPLCATWIAFHPSLFLRKFMKEFISLFAPHVSNEQIEESVNRENERIDPQKSTYPIHAMWHI
ncbi:MAG: LysR substrate-binding domain-containing protein [Marinicellaceae bacterium]